METRARAKWQYSTKLPAVGFKSIYLIRIQDDSFIPRRIGTKRQFSNEILKYEYHRLKEEVVLKALN